MAHWPWDKRCTLMGCEAPRRPHHHHYAYGHLSTFACACPRRDQPGTTMDERKAER